MDPRKIEKKLENAVDWFGRYDMVPKKFRANLSIRGNPKIEMASNGVTTDSDDLLQTIYDACVALYRDEDNDTDDTIRAAKERLLRAVSSDSDDVSDAAAAAINDLVQATGDQTTFEDCEDGDIVEVVDDRLEVVTEHQYRVLDVDYSNQLRAVRTEELNGSPNTSTRYFSLDHEVDIVEKAPKKVRFDKVDRNEKFAWGDWEYVKIDEGSAVRDDLEITCVYPQTKVEPLEDE